MPREAEATARAKAIPSNEAISAVRYALCGRVLRRNVLIALIVGGALTAANQFDVILRGPVRANLLLKICVNFVIPFVVSSISAAANRWRP